MLYRKPGPGERQLGSRRGDFAYEYKRVNAHQAPLRETVRTGGRNTAGRGSAPTPDPVRGSSSWKPGPTFVREVMPLASLSLGSAMACFAARRSRLSPLFITYDCQEVSGWS